MRRGHEFAYFPRVAKRFPWWTKTLYDGGAALAAANRDSG
jgi:hypothetical protein